MEASQFCRNTRAWVSLYAQSLRTRVRVVDKAGLNTYSLRTRVRVVDKAGFVGIAEAARCGASCSTEVPSVEQPGVGLSALSATAVQAYSLRSFFMNENYSNLSGVIGKSRMRLPVAW
jgi:hypothetical protein